VAVCRQGLTRLHSIPTYIYPHETRPLGESIVFHLRKMHFHTQNTFFRKEALARDLSNIDRNVAYSTINSFLAEFPPTSGAHSQRKRIINSGGGGGILIDILSQCPFTNRSSYIAKISRGEYVYLSTDATYSVMHGIVHKLL
jgi:hypothetical protein